MCVLTSQAWIRECLSVEPARDGAPHGVDVGTPWHSSWQSPSDCIVGHPSSGPGARRSKLPRRCGEPRSWRTLNDVGHHNRVVDAGAPCLRRSELMGHNMLKRSSRRSRPSRTKPCSGSQSTTPARAATALRSATRRSNLSMNQIIRTRLACREPPGGSGRRTRRRPWRRPPKGWIPVGAMTRSGSPAHR